MGSTLGSGSRGGTYRAGGCGAGGLESAVCDDEGGSGWGVLSEAAVEGDEVLCAARRCVVAGRWAAGLDTRVGGRRWGDGGLEVAVAGADGQIRSPQEYGGVPLQRRSGSGPEMIPGLTRHEERSKPRRPRWTMGRRRAACKPNGEERQ